jgi:hypothetical protein
MAAKGVLVWRGDFGSPEGHYGKSVVADVTTDEALATLQTALAAYSDCNKAKRSFSTQTIGTDTLPGADANVDLRAVCYFRDPTTLKTHSVTIPAPKSTMIEDKPEGQRVTSAAMTAIVGAINTATGKTYSAMYGVIEQKR